jgi:CRISPR/Cas system-associated exonuclease Cas4 (RecB family)
MVRGTKIHSHIEDYLNKKVDVLDQSVQMNRDTIMMLRNSGYEVLTEADWSVDVNWKSCPYDDWENCWLRVKVDAAYTRNENDVVVFDWKTGRTFNPSYINQLELYALSALLHFPDKKRVTASLVYVDTGEIKPATGINVYSSDVEKLKEKWLALATPMLTDTEFRPNRGAHCSRCFYNDRCE